jgi:O-acetylhomoserine (thiol)-lyase
METTNNDAIDKTRVVNESLETSPYKELTEKYFPKGAGSTFTFGFKGGIEEIYKFIKSVELFSYQANVEDAR